MKERRIEILTELVATGKIVNIDPFCGCLGELSEQEAVAVMSGKEPKYSQMDSPSIPLPAEGQIWEDASDLFRIREFNPEICTYVLEALITSKYSVIGKKLGVTEGQILEPWNTWSPGRHLLGGPGAPHSLRSITPWPVHDLHYMFDYLKISEKDLPIQEGVKFYTINSL